MNITTTKLQSLLASGPQTFQFEKKDGTFRTMTATTNNDWIPEGVVKQDNKKVLKVYDIQKKGFRSITHGTYVEM